MFALDLHTHSRFFHGWPGTPTPFDPVGARLNAAVARVRDLDGFVLTNHDYCYRSSVGMALPGIEVSTTEGHVLVIGPNPPARTEVDELTPHELCDLAHENDCATVLAHPFRHGSALDSGADFDAVEINGKNPEHIEQTKALAERLDLPLVGGSDAHYPVEVGRAYTHVDAEELTPEAVADAIREGRVTAMTRFSRFDSLVDRAYTRIHQVRHG